MMYSYFIAFEFIFASFKYYLISTVGENIIATFKMRNNFCCPLKMVIFQYCFSFCLTLFYLLQFLYIWYMASFLYCFPYSYRSSNCCNSNSCRSSTLLKALAKSNGNPFAIAFKSEKERQLLLSKKKQRTDSIKD